jgi:hypothetical protein
MSALRASLLRLYPRAWRERYGAEMEEVLAGQSLSLRTFADVVAGAIDAHANRQWVPAVDVANTQGEKTMSQLSWCEMEGVTARDQRRSAAWMIGGSIVLTSLALVLVRVMGQNSLSEGLIYSAFPASLMLSSECTYLKRYSRRSRTVMSVVGAVVVILMTWASVAIGNLL